MLAPLIEELNSRGIRLSIQSGRLICTASPDALTPELKARIQDAKPELLKMMNEADQAIDLAQPIEHLADQISYSLSSAQLRIAIAGHARGILPSAFRLSGRLNAEILEETLNLFVMRHAPLHTRFELSGQQLQQTVISHQRFTLPRTSLIDESGASLEKTLSRMQSIQLNPAEGICYHFELIELAAEEHVLYAAFSPLVFDGWSFDVFWNEITAAYAALLADNNWPVPALEFSYADCAAWLQKRIEYRAGELKLFWQQQLGETLPLDIFPTATRASPHQPSVHVPFELDPETTALLREFSMSRGISAQVILLACVYIWSFRLRGVTLQEPDDASALDIILGIAVEGRPQRSMEKLVGAFANLILMREHIPQDDSFVEFTARIQDDLMQAHQHQEFPINLHKIQSHSGSAKTFQIEFSFQQTAGRSANMGPLQFEQIELRSGTSPVDLAFWVKDWGNRIAGAIEFQASSFDQATIEQWIRCYHTLLGSMLKAPDTPICQFKLFSAKEAERISEAMPEQLPAIVDGNKHIVPFAVPGKIKGLSGLYTLDEKNGLKPCVQHTVVSNVVDEYQWPQSDTELRLEILLQNILGERIGVESDFFASGLNSLLAMRFVVQCQQEMGIQINIPVLFEHPTISRLAAYLSSSHTLNNTRLLVPLQANGNLPPLYCICGINIYRQLAIALGEMQPSFAIHIAKERELIISTQAGPVADLAQLYWEVIEQQHSGKTLRLLGFCFGGALAYEIALIARKQGYEIEQLILVDTALATKLKRRLPSRIIHRFPQSMRNRIKRLINKSPRAEPIDVNSDANTKNMQEVLSSRLDSFVPSTQYDGQTIIIDSGDTEMYASWRKTPQLGWEGTFTGPVDHINLNTRHLSVLSTPNTETIARQLQYLFAIN